jgi:hypothetical protein
MTSIHRDINGYPADYTGFYPPKKPSQPIAILLPHLIATLPFLLPNKAIYILFNNGIKLFGCTLTQ